MNLNLGRLINKKKITRNAVNINSDDLMTHTIICGSTGSGKTVLGKLLIEEAAKAGIASIIIDLKGDLSSMAIPISRVTYSEFEPWVDAKDKSERQKKAAQIVDIYKNSMRRTGVDPKSMEIFRNSVDIRIYTPKSTAGEQISLSLINSPVNSSENENRETLINMLSANGASVIDRIYPDKNIDDLYREKAFIESALKALWKKNYDLEGKKGIILLIKEILNPSFEKIGIFKTKDFIDPASRKDIAVRLNTLLIGAQALWYEGTSINNIIKSIDKKNLGRTKVAIFNLSFLERFEDRNMVVSQIAFQLFNHFRKKIDSVGPRVIFYIDEIGSGEHSYFPAEPFHNASKASINMLLRQGRAFGLCTVLSTQNPGDIDYTALTNCHTWFVGKLLTAEDRKKVIEGIAAQELQFEDVDDIIKTAETGEFLVKKRNGDIDHFQERWLYTFHKVVSHDEFEKIHYAINFKETYNNGINLMNKKEYEKALKHFNKAAITDPKDPKIWSAIGIIHSKMDLLEKSLEAYEKARALSLMDETCWLDSALILFRLKKYDKSIKYLQEVVSLNKENVKAWYQMGYIFNITKKYTEAENSLKEALKHDTKHHEALYIRGLVNIKLNKKEIARDFFDKAITLSDTNPDYYNALADVLFELDSYILALEAYDKSIKLNPLQLPPRFGKTKVFIEIEEYSNALSEIENIIKFDPENSEALILKAEMAWRSLEFNKALESYQIVLERDPQNLTALLRSGLSSFECKQDEMSLIYLKKYIDNKGDEYDAFYKIGILYERKNEFKQARNHFIKAEKITPGNTELRKKIALLFFEEKSYNNASEWFLKCLEIKPDDEASWYLGNINFKNAQYKECTEYWKKSTDLDLCDYDFFKNFYIASMEIKDLDLALTNINKALRMKSNINDSILKAKLYNLKKQYEDALDIYDILKKQEPENPKIWINMAETFKMIKEDSKAEYCRKEAIKFGWKE